ncbi:MAG: formylglycine-generating enzyme family protein [Myxococcales bacterium]|nr:formylglycine-generating enzyme family protein [Myxococcales bacterium]
MRGGLVGWVALLTGSVAGCTPTAENRPQLVVILDTDLPVSGQLLSDPKISPDAAIDTLRIDLLDDTGASSGLLTVVASDPADWPVSFGIAGGSGRVRVRARAFRSGWAGSGESGGESVFEPVDALTVGRVIELDLPSDGVRRVRAVLRGDCLGVPSSFADPAQTCVGKGNESVAATQGVEVLDGHTPATEIGTWARARDVPCSGSAPVGATCIAGGYAVIGEPSLSHVSDGILSPYDPTPARPVAISPFHLDVREYTVERLRAALGASPSLLVGDEMPTVRDLASETLRTCTFLGLSDDGHDAYPLNCVSLAAARKLCQQAGGELPSEAQWEFAARGRGQRRFYAWGDDPPTCCDATFGMKYGGCPGDGPAETNGGPGCGDHIDATRDGVLDMTGNLQERTRSALAPYEAPCWGGQGVLDNPVCQTSDSTHAARGGTWSFSPAVAMLALRFTALDQHHSPYLGFRCAYPDVGAKP